MAQELIYCGEDRSGLLAARIELSKLLPDTTLFLEEWDEVHGHRLEVISPQLSYDELWVSIGKTRFLPSCLGFQNLLMEDTIHARERIKNVIHKLGERP